MVAMAAALPDRDTTKDIAYWGRTKEVWLREFLVLNNGVPSENRRFCGSSERWTRSNLRPHSAAGRPEWG